MEIWKIDSDVGTVNRACLFLQKSGFADLCVYIVCVSVICISAMAEVHAAELV